MTAFRTTTDDPRNPNTPPGAAALPLPVIVLTLERPKLGSPIRRLALRALTPVPALLVIVLPPTMSAVALITFTPNRPRAPFGSVPFPMIWFMAMNAEVPTDTWTPLEPLKLMVLPAAAFWLSRPMRAEAPLLTRTPTREFWVTVEFTMVAWAASIATPSRGFSWIAHPSTTPLAPKV